MSDYVDVFYLGLNGWSPADATGTLQLTDRDDSFMTPPPLIMQYLFFFFRPSVR